MSFIKSLAAGLVAAFVLLAPAQAAEKVTIAAAADLKFAMDEIAATYGVHLTSQLSFRVADLSLIADAMARVRATPPSALAGEPVTSVDLATGSAELPPTDGMLFTGDRVRVVVRPSGTEPKLKCYLQVRRPAGGDLGAERARAAVVMAQARADMTRALGL